MVVCESVVSFLVFPRFSACSSRQSCRAAWGHHTSLFVSKDGTPLDLTCSVQTVEALWKHDHIHISIP